MGVLVFACSDGVHHTLLANGAANRVWGRHKDEERERENLGTTKELARKHVAEHLLGAYC